jgi:hypothetical protein
MIHPAPPRSLGDAVTCASWRGACALTLRATRSCAPCGRHGRAGHRQSRDRQARHDAPELDRLVHSVTVTDPQHPFFGRTFPIVRPVSGRGNTRLRIRLPDGEIRAIPRSATDLEAPSPPAGVPSEVPWVSVRTLLPVARFVRLLISAAEEVSPDVGLRSGRPATAAASVLSSASGLASVGPRSPHPDRAATGATDSTHPHPPVPERGDTR